MLDKLEQMVAELRDRKTSHLEAGLGVLARSSFESPALQADKTIFGAVCAKAKAQVEQDSPDSKFLRPMAETGLPGGLAQTAAEGKFPLVLKALGKKRTIMHEWTVGPGRFVNRRLLEGTRDRVFRLGGSFDRFEDGDLDEDGLALSIAKDSVDEAGSAGDAWLPLAAHFGRVSAHELAGYKSTVDLLEVNQRRGRLTSEGIDGERLRRLLGSRLPDLKLLGLHALELLPDSSRENVAWDLDATEPMAHYLLSDSNRDEAREIATRIFEGKNKEDVVPEHEPGYFGVLEKQIDAIDSRDRNERSQRAIGKSAGSGRMLIIVHGTWAARFGWWKPGGEFWTYIRAIKENLYEGENPFRWSGANKHEKRVEAAKKLVEWAEAHGVTELDAIAHSHGGNVCFLASQFGLRFRKLITLGTPIRLEYLPNLRNIGALHNIFSTRDMIQTPAGTLPNRRAEGRTLGDTLEVTNHFADNNEEGIRPGHSGLHEPGIWRICGFDKLL